MPHPARIDPFGAANYAGAIAALLLALLLPTSNDASTRRLGAGTRQNVHRTVEWALILTLLHGSVYQWVEKREPAIVMVFMLVAAAAILIRVSVRGARGPREARRSAEW